MIKSYNPTSPYSQMPESPFIKVGEIVNQYSTGTHYKHVYSDNPAQDIPELLDNSCFLINTQFAAEIEVQGVACFLKRHRKVGDTLIQYLAIPKRKTSNSKTQLIVLSKDEVKQKILDQLKEYVPCAL
ncbi:hypothetical protein [Motilimonas eburnea]|uniref:hypothetical protein n=1 Tax=Motilimonas eburnea TaxID=1737488 RepID=UPI001E4F512F|nr:hypothetical protein [Motilimonas eburnea]MCE2571675.1 hypothetical protein [Motilimonas eburnea]